MGLLALGTPLRWPEAKKYADHVRQHGITQFLNIWDRLKGREWDTLLWGDEIEYIVISFDDENKNARVSLRQEEILAELSQVVTNLCTNEPAKNGSIPTFHPEYGRYMLESTPGSPYSGSLPDLLSVEANMRYRRKIARFHLKPHEIPVTLTSFPRLGVQGVFSDPHYDPANAVSSHSLFLPQEITNPHVRFPTLTANIRERRGSKVAINLPIFFDSNTPRPFIDPTIPWDRDIYPEDHEAKNGAALPDHVYLDAMGFGMGCCCLQITFQACNVDEARRVYDALVPIGPIMLALSAASPLHRGYITDVDARWNVISGSVDDRTDEERGLKPLKENRFRIPKSRYGSVSSYLSTDLNNRPEYSDIEFPYDEAIFQRVVDHGIDEILAKHVAHLFIRDPLVIFSESIDQDDSVSSDHFENIQSTNWQTMRFKPPPPNSNVGWRVEFRSMEVQITDFENAAFSIFVVLLSRAILSFGLNFYIPISKVDENMDRAQRRNAAREQKFWFRKNIYPFGVPPLSHATPSETPPTRSPPKSPASTTTDLPALNTKLEETSRFPTHNHAPSPTTGSSRCPTPPSPKLGPVEDECIELTMDEIINGKGEDFPGLLGVVNAYLNSLNVEFAMKRKMRAYLDLIKRRANGSLMTTATWIRNFVRSHPAYKFDSVVSPEINYDLIHAIDQIERGKRREDGLLPKDYVGSVVEDGCL